MLQETPAIVHWRECLVQLALVSFGSVGNSAEHDKTILPSLRQKACPQNLNQELILGEHEMIRRKDQNSCRRVGRQDAGRGDENRSAVPPGAGLFGDPPRIHKGQALVQEATVTLSYDDDDMGHDRPVERLDPLCAGASTGSPRRRSTASVEAPRANDRSSGASVLPPLRPGQSPLEFHLACTGGRPASGKGPGIAYCTLIIGPETRAAKGHVSLETALKSGEGDRK